MIAAFNVSLAQEYTSTFNSAQSRMNTIWATARPAFLVLTPCCLSIAFAFVVAEQHNVNYLHLILVLIGGLSAHISVNMFNEYQDFCSGLDFNTQRTDFSGGSGALPKAPELAKLVQRGAKSALALTMVIGWYFIAVSGWELLPIGLLGVLSVYFYTNKITHNPWLCLIVPGFAFGILMINGAYFVLTGHYSSAVFSASLIPMCLVNNLLLLNQFPDQEADKDVGRCHLPIFIGRQKAAWVYSGFLLAAYFFILLNYLLGLAPLASLISLLSVFLAVPAINIANRFYDDIERLKPALAWNVAVTLVTPVLLGVGILI